MSLYLLIYDLATTTCNNVQHDTKMKVLITIIIALLFLNLEIDALLNIFLWFSQDKKSS